MPQHFSFRPDADIINRTRWYIAFRWFYILLVAVPIGVSIYFSEGVTLDFMVIIGALVAALGLNGLFFITSRLLKSFFQYQLLAAIIPLVDILIVTSSVAMVDVTEGQSVVLYVIPIVMSAATLGRKGLYMATLVSLISYDAVFIHNFTRHLHTNEALQTIVLASTALLAVLFAVDYIIRLLRERERQALKIVDDLTRAQRVGKFGSWETNVLDGTVAWSDEIFRLLGLRLGTNLTADAYMEFIHPEDRRRVSLVMQRATKQPKRFRVDYRVIMASGQLRYFHAEGESLADRSNQVALIIGTVRDTTEEKQLDQSKNEFVALASHQLRTPATVVKQYLAMLLDGYAGEVTSRQKDFLTTALETNDRQIAIVNNLLDVAQLESGKIRLHLEAIDIIRLLESIAKEYQAQAEVKKQTLLFKPHRKQLFCLVDTYYLRSVLENIVDNALRYTPEQKTIMLSVKSDSRSISIIVKDQGIGIADEDIPKLFLKFSRIEHPQTFQEEGAGLGLYWSQKVVALHSGRIEVASTPGKGSTFTVILPRKQKTKR